MTRTGSATAVPSATYRFQITPDFGFDDAAATLDHVAALGISHVYLSPVLQPAPGSTHGYDVVDHTRLNEEAGGREAFERLVRRAHELDLGIIVDLVPNHMAVPTPEHLNAPLWGLLREGRESRWARWFDVDWEVRDGRILMPFLGGSVADALAAGELTLARDGGRGGDELVVRYYEHELPVRADMDAETAEGMPLEQLIEQQHWELAHWKVGDTDLNYRRFFNINTLIAIRVEDPEVFDASHALILELLREGSIDGLRIDHPDGLADPAGYVERLAEVTDGAWVVIEKILEGDEKLPFDWPCAGTTGYDAAMRVAQVLTSRVAETTDRSLDETWAAMAPKDTDLQDVITRSKELVVEAVQAPELSRLVRIAHQVVPHLDEDRLRRALGALLVSMDRYRAYLRPTDESDPWSFDEGQVEVIAQAHARARDHVDPELHEALFTIAHLAEGILPAGGLEEMDDAHHEFVVRFAQTCGPVMAKGIEDTAFYRWFRQSGANEVGGHPQHLSIDDEAFHEWAAEQLRVWPDTMTTLTTHDTKRSEDVRARLSVLAEHPSDWAAFWDKARRLSRRHQGERVDEPTLYLLWQTLVGAHPVDGDRIEGYVLKAVREAKQHTAWVDGDEDYERQVVALARGLAEDDAVNTHITTWLYTTTASTRAAVLGQKLVQLTVPGVPDVYQGSEMLELSLVDPDNRRPVDFDRRRARLRALDDGVEPRGLDDEKLLVTARALRKRRAHPEWFGRGSLYEPVPGPENVLAFARGLERPEAITVVGRWVDSAVAAAGPDESPWGAGVLDVPPGSWRDLMTGTVHTVGIEGPGAPTGLPVAELLAQRPVAMLVREDV